MVRNYILFFGLGVLISGRIHAWITRAGSGLILCLSLLFFALLTLLVACGAEKIYLVAPVAAMTGTAGVVALAVFLDRATRLAFVRQWGVVSLQIFVAHTVATAGFRIVLQKGMGVDAPLLQVLGGTVAGMYVPILLDRICNRVGFRYLFTLR